MSESPFIPSPGVSAAGHRLEAFYTQVGGVIEGDPGVRITGVNSLDAARAGELTFAESEKYLSAVEQSQAAAIIVPPAFPSVAGKTLWRVEKPRLAFIQVVNLLRPPALPPRGIDRHAVVAADAQLGEQVTIRECAVIHSKARIGRGTVIETGVHVGEGVVIGENCYLGPNVVVMHASQIGNRVIVHGGAIIGADGFGFLWDGQKYVKVPQIGNVIIEDDVELGANVCVDRATLGSTLIKRGTKIDNLVQIAHNDVLGEHVTVSGQAGFAGSVKIGNNVVIGGQVGVADHITVGDGARIGAGSGVIKDVQPGQTVWWFPARPIQKIKRELAAMSFLPDLLKKWKTENNHFPQAKQHATARK